MKNIIKVLFVSLLVLASCASDEDKIKEDAKSLVKDGFEGLKDAEKNTKAAAEGIKEGLGEIKEDME